MNASRPVPRFVFAYVSRAPRSVEDFKHPAIARQLTLINRYLADVGRAAGKLFPAMPTYRGRTFVDHPAFEQAVTYARHNDVPLVVGHLDDLLSRIPPDRFLACANELRALDIVMIDARTGGVRTGWSSPIVTLDTGLEIKLAPRFAAVVWLRRAAPAARCTNRDQYGGGHVSSSCAASARPQ